MRRQYQGRAAVDVDGVHGRWCRGWLQNFLEDGGISSSCCDVERTAIIAVAILPEVINSGQEQSGLVHPAELGG